KGVAVLDLGRVTLENGIRPRLIIVRRISRTKKNGRWRVRTFYYGIATNLDLTAPKLYAFYHRRQCIEAGFRELKNHYHLERLPFQSLKANEFWIMCKITAMTLFKIFQHEMLPKALRSLLRKTLSRRIFRKGFRLTPSEKLEVVSKSKYTWLLRRLLCKTERMKDAMNTC
ncbi:MAG: transposase, partial [Desulfobacterales bacterium]|nr:transposase [Desulfobacterales bacterium]